MTDINEWRYAEAAEGIIFCEGRDFGNGRIEAVAAYYQDKTNAGYKKELEGDRTYSRFIYQGHQEEQERLPGLPDRNLVDAYLTRSNRQVPGLIIERDQLNYFDPKFRSVDFWLSAQSDGVKRFQDTLAAVVEKFEAFDVVKDGLLLYGSTSFGLVDRVEKPVEDVDIVFPISRVDEMKRLVASLSGPYGWDQIDPQGKLAPTRKLYKAKRWSTSQLRTNIAGTDLTVDLKVGRDISFTSGWADFVDVDAHDYIGEVQVLDDTEGYSISPVLVCEDRKGRVLKVLAEGYQYIGTLIKGDVAILIGDLYPDQDIVRLDQSAKHQIIPDFSRVAVS